MLSYEIFNKGIASLVKVFPNLDIDVNTIWMFINDLEDKDFLKGMSNLITTRTDMYPGTNVIALIRDYSVNRDKKTALEAWSEVVKQTGQEFWISPKFSSSLISNIVDCIGWHNICDSEKIGIERTQFMKEYDVLIAREKKNNVIKEIEYSKKLCKESINSSN